VGHAQAIRLNRDGGFYEGGADPRNAGAAAGYQA
jgi:gamma-glutamyltranspeptidase/glutathione hydrolase